MWPQRSGSSQVTRTPRACGEVLDRVEHRVVLDAAGDHAVEGGVLRAAGEPGALDGEVVGLGAAGGEDDLGRPGAQGGADPLARLLDHGAGRTPGGVQRGGVADHGGLLHQGLERGRQHGGRRRVVEVGSHGRRVYVRGRRTRPPRRPPVRTPAAAGGGGMTSRPARRPPAARRRPRTATGSTGRCTTSSRPSVVQTVPGPLAVEPGDVERGRRQPDEEARHARPPQAGTTRAPPLRARRPGPGGTARWWPGRRCRTHTSAPTSPSERATSPRIARTHWTPCATHHAADDRTGALSPLAATASCGGRCRVSPCAS